MHRECIKYVEIKCQLDATEVFSADLIAYSTMPIIKSSRLLYSVCCLWYFVLWFSICWSGVELRVMCPVCTKYHRQQPLYNTLELLMMGIVVLEIC